MGDQPEGKAFTRRAFLKLGSGLLTSVVVSANSSAALAVSREPQFTVVTIPPRPRVNGKPIFGSFNVWSLEDIRRVQALGVNLIHDYHRDVQMQQLNVRSPMGRALRERGTKVLYNLVRHVKRGDTCVCDTESATKDLLAVRESPNLWGYWVLDDMEGDQKRAAQDLYELVKRCDPRHTVVAGFGGTDSLVNFDAGVCDLVAFYPYPIFNGRYHRRYIDHNLEVGLKVVADRCPGIPFLGVVQTFYQPMYGSFPKPTSLQVREQAEDYLRSGAVGLMNYGWRVYQGKSASSYPDLERELAHLGVELSRGTFPVANLPSPEPLARRDVDQWQTECESPTGFGSLERPTIGQQLVPSQTHLVGMTIMPHHESRGDSPVHVELYEAGPTGLPSETVSPLARVSIPDKQWRQHADHDLFVPLSAELIPGKVYVISLSCTGSTPGFQRFAWSSFAGLGRPSYSKGHLVERSGTPLRWRGFWDNTRSLYFASHAR